MELYKGYVLTNGKKPIESFKNKKNLKTLEQVKDSPEYAGILADDVIVIDIDDKDQSEILMNIVEDLQLDCIVRQTFRGRHFLFKNNGVESCGAGKKLACGLTADIKVGSHNSTQQLKLNGEERFIEWDCEEPEPLPKWLFPVKTSVDFFNMKEGDGRDSALYSYILTLTAAGFSQDQSKQAIGLINKYVLADSLSDEDIERITREEAFPKETFYDGKAFLHNNFASFLASNNHIKRINGQLYVYKDGVYVFGAREIEAAMIKYLPNLKAAQRTEVLKYLDIICVENTEGAGANLIAFKNGIYNIATDELTEFDPNIVITNKIPWNYDPAAYSELADNTLNKMACGDANIRALLEEAIGYCFYRHNEMSKAFFLLGEGANGKSTFLDIVKNILGAGNFSALDLNEMEERFSVATMGGMLANVGDDIADDFLQGRGLAILKKIVSGNQIKAEIKNDPNIYFMKPYIKPFFSANTLPRTKSRGLGALLRRMVIIPFNAKFSKSDPAYDPYITWKLKEKSVMEYIIVLAVEGLKRVLTNNGFSESTKVQRELEEYEIENNPVLLFLQEREPYDFENQPTSEVHREYKKFCVENGFTEITLPNFSKEIKRQLNLTTRRIRIDGKLVTIYSRK